MAICRRDPAAHGEAEDIRSTQVEVIDEGRRVVGTLLVRERTVDVSGVPVALRLDGNHLPRLSQRPHEWTHQLDGHEATGSRTSGLPVP